jgi:hypothetical protein
VVERQQNIAIQEQEIIRREKELDSKVRIGGHMEGHSCIEIPWFLQ